MASRNNKRKEKRGKSYWKELKRGDRVDSIAVSVFVFILIEFEDQKQIPKEI